MSGWRNSQAVEITTPAIRMPARSFWLRERYIKVLLPPGRLQQRDMRQGLLRNACRVQNREPFGPLSFFHVRGGVDFQRFAVERTIAFAKYPQFEFGHGTLLARLGRLHGLLLLLQALADGVQFAAEELGCPFRR